VKWPTFLIILYLALALEGSFAQALNMQSMGDITPSLVITLVVFVAMFAPRLTTLWSCWLMGMLMDLSLQYPGEIIVVGPHALGYLLAGLLILQIRSMVFRKRVLTFVLLTFAAMLMVSIVVVAVLTVQSLYLGENAGQVAYFTRSGALRELLWRFGSSVYSAVLAAPLGWALVQTIPFWGFSTNLQSRTAGW
jgi:rod shape-determining protein MreD